MIITIMAVACDPVKSNESRYLSCVRYVDGNVANYDHSAKEIIFTNGNSMPFHGEYGLGIDTTKVTRIEFHPRREYYGNGLIESVRFIPNDSIGIFPTENLCKVGVKLSTEKK